MLRVLATLSAIVLGAGMWASAQDAVDGPPPGDAPHTWLYGAGDLASLPITRALGLNTVFLEMPAHVPAPALDEARFLIREAGRYGLHVIVGIPTTMGGTYQVSLGNTAYVNALGAWVRDAVPALSGEPAVIGWATGDYLEKDLVLSDSDFATYVQRKYGSVARANQVWGADLRSLAGVTMQAAAELDDELPFAAGMSSVDLADYQARRFEEMMAFWARLVRDAIPADDLLLTGRVTLYRSLPLVPDAYDVVVLSMPPDLLEPDWETHNVQAIDMARRGGRRNVIPCLRLPGPLDESGAYHTQRLHEWMMLAAMHGAVGLSFEAEPAVMRERLVHEQLRAGLSWMSEQPALRSRPRGAAAVLYEPYADGFSSLNVPVYGFIGGLSSREPSDLCNAFKQGTRFGLMEYLALEDLGTAGLSRYSVIFAPMALDLPEGAQGLLADYVSAGGVLVADIGAGFVQTGSWQALPPRLQALFGVGAFHEMKSMTGNLTIHQPHHAFPSLPSGAVTTGDFEGAAHGRRTGTGAYAFSGWVGFTIVPPGSVPFARLAMSVTEDKQPTFAGVIMRDVGAGTAVFATHRLWSSWLPGHRLFDEFHSALWQRRATVELLGAPFVSSSVTIAESDDGSVLLYNPGARVRAQLALYAGRHRLFSDAVCQFSSTLVDEGGLRTGGVLATLDAPEHGSMAVEPTPIEVRPFTGVSSAMLERQSERSISIVVGGDGSAPGGKLGKLRVERGKRQKVRLTVGSGRYRIAPGSRHHLRADDDLGQSTEQTLTADTEGRLTAELDLQRARVLIEPARR